MSSDAEDGQEHEHQERLNEEPKQEPPDPWRFLQGAAELSALYFAYRQNEGAAQFAQALALLIQMSRHQR